MLYYYYYYYYFPAIDGLTFFRWTPLIFLLHFLQVCASSGDRPNLFLSPLIPCHHDFLRHPLGLVRSTSIIVPYLIQSVSSLHSMCPNHLNVTFLVTKMTGSNPNSTLNSEFFFLSCKVNLHIHHDYSLNRSHFWFWNGPVHAQTVPVSDHFLDRHWSVHGIFTKEYVGMLIFQKFFFRSWEF